MIVLRSESAFLLMMDTVALDLWARILRENVLVSREVCKWLKNSVDAHSALIFDGSFEILRELSHVRFITSIMMRPMAVERISSKAISVLLDIVSGLCGIGEEYQKLRASNSPAQCELNDKYGKFCDDGGLIGVLRFMRRYIHCRTILENGCQILMYITRNEVIRKKASAEGAIWIVTEAMQHHKMDTGVQMWACRAFVNLFSFGDNLKAETGALAALESIHTAIDAHAADAAIVQAAHEAICNLAYDDAIQLAAIAGGACERAVRSMRRHPEHAGVLREACAALFNLCFDRSARARARDAGGVAAIEAALAAHPCDAALARDGEDALRKICEA
jgi:hypothetical protein